MLRLCILVVFVAALVRGQSTNASITGRVSDPSKALVANAAIAAVSSGTNARYATLTNAAGEYHLANLPPGRYRIEIEKPGFKRLIKPDVILHVQDALEIGFEMALGERSEIITVEAGAPLVNAESGTVSTVIDRTFVENLPLNGRSFQTLIMLTPGVVLATTRYDDQGQFSVNGQRSDANYFTVDGVSANFGVTGYIAMVETASGSLPAFSASGGTNSLVSVDAMQEFRIQTSTFAPEFGRTPGGQISIVTRSGANDFHGSLSEYFRNDALDARSWFVNFNGLAKPAERANDFGGVLGGPVRKDKAFFFLSYEGLRLRQPSTMQTAVPDAASRQQAPSATRPYLNVYPIANGAPLGAGLAQFNASFSNPSTLNAYSLRLDETISAKLNLFGRYNYSPSDLVQRGPVTYGPVLSQTSALSSSIHTGTAGLTILIGPHSSNEVRANYSNHRIGTENDVDSFGGAVPLPASALFPAGVSAGNGLFGLYILGAGQFNQGTAGSVEQRQVNLVDNFSATLGSHQFKSGVDYRWLAPFTSPFAYRQYVQFSDMTAAPGGALSTTAAVAGIFATTGNALLARNFSLYLQDTWRVTPHLTVTYGLRWDVNPALKGKNPANDPYTVVGLDQPSTIALAPHGTPLYRTTYANLAPRLGIAWQIGGSPNWARTVRAGVGLFYDLGQGSLGGVTSYFPYSATKLIQPAPFPLSPADALPPAITTNPPVANILVADPDLVLPRSYQWNLALEQALGGSQSLSLTYVGAVGRDLLRVTQRVNPNPDFQGVNITDNSATSDYHALQLKLQRRFSRGLQGLASYSFSHSIDNVSSNAFSSYLNLPGWIGDPNTDRGSSDFDIRHAFSAGVTYDLPGTHGHKGWRAVSNGWSLDAFVLARSAPPAGVFFQAAGTGVYPRPNLVPGVPLELYGSGYPGGKIFNRAAFIAVPVGHQGNFGRNVLRAFGAAQADIGVQRTLRLNERAGLRLRGEFFNILNHPNFGSPTSSLNSALFGRSTQTLANALGAGGASGGFNPLYQIGGARSIQLALKLQF